MIKTTQEIYNEAQINYNIVENNKEWIKVQDMIKLIDGDIKFQKSKLINDFEQDKSIQWRVIGMESLKSKLTQKQVRR